MLLALTGCKVSVNTNNADTAKPNPGAEVPNTDPKPLGNGENGEGRPNEADGEGQAEPTPTDGEAANPGGTLTSQAPASCEDGQYKPGDSWKVECNTCKCTDDGQSMCTRMACEGGGE